MTAAQIIELVLWRFFLEFQPEEEHVEAAARAVAEELERHGKLNA